MTDSSFTARAQLVHDAVASPLSDLYRNLYGRGRGAVKSEHEWSQIPLLTREHLAHVQYGQRVFVKSEEIRVIRSSSGTSGRSVIITPRSGIRAQFSRFEEIGANITGYMAFMNPLAIIEEGLRADGATFSIIAGDLSEPEACARTIATLGINALHIYLHGLETLRPHLEKYDLANKIEIIELFGERATLPAIHHIQKHFPRAALILSYGMSEVQGAFARCTIAAGSDIPELWHQPDPDYFFEVRTEDGMISAAPEPHSEGELIVTSLAPYARALPIIRYATGDRVITGGLVRAGSFDMIMVEREKDDRLKMLSGMLWREELERALVAVLGANFSGEYAFELDDTPAGDTSNERGILYLPRPLMQSIHDRDDLLQRFAYELRVGPARTYADGVRDKLFGPLSLAELAPARHGSKLKHLYRKAP